MLSSRGEPREVVEPREAFVRRCDRVVARKAFELECRRREGRAHVVDDRPALNGKRLTRPVALRDRVDGHVRRSRGDVRVAAPANEKAEDDQCGTDRRPYGRERDDAGDDAYRADSDGVAEPRLLCVQMLRERLPENIVDCE